MNSRDFKQGLKAYSDAFRAIDPPRAHDLLYGAGMCIDLEPYSGYLNPDLLLPKCKPEKDAEKWKAKKSAEQETTEPKPSQSREIILFRSGKSKEIILYKSSSEILKLRK